MNHTIETTFCIERGDTEFEIVVNVEFDFSPGRAATLEEPEEHNELDICDISPNWEKTSCVKGIPDKHEIIKHIDDNFDELSKDFEQECWDYLED